MNRRTVKFLINTVLVLISHTVFAQNSPAPLKLVDILLTPDHADWNYKAGEEAQVKVTVLKYGVPIKNAEIEYSFGQEMMEPEVRRSLKLKEGYATIHLGTSKQPGFRQLKVKTKHQGNSYENQIKLAFSPEKIKAATVLPADFSQFWKQNIEAIRDIELSPVLEHLPGHSSSTVNVYLVSIQVNEKGQRLYGYLCKPKKPGRYPVLFSPPGAGVKPFAPSTSFADQGFISFTTEIHGLSPMIDASVYKNISSAFGDYWLNNLHNRDTYYYKKVYLGCVKAIDYLCTLPEFDGENIVVSGGSQGGALAIVTAALHPKVKCLVSFYPALSDISGYLHNRAGGWPHMLNPYHAKFNNRPENLNTISYYDVVNFARQITIPGFYSWGYNDNTCPPTSIYAAVNSVTAPKTLRITPISGHWRFEETNRESIAWIKKQLNLVEPRSK
jgi:cephalosporin-C deacetylase-like acetyl esterase